MSHAEPEPPGVPRQLPTPGRLRGPLLLTRPGALSPEVNEFLGSRADFVDEVLVFGGNRVVGDSVLSAARAATG